ncbi:AI-2E family transporter [Lacrimispora sp. 210928-DFI.3.58]|uniref:AI-2E family transporter n=1 Tax=Lacrimispora sp. 210928-DFI.3.58 TaxID=2883214 RepID=UPI0015B44F58|nr:AI-2E family transporter [Lacrimispora sp. 210928-DFI.3.58]MCB7317950.1 AI-2E family transporter [Lacrimispora sp. 210928-DFI.3.58]
MKNPKFKQYIYWGVTALAVIACSVAFGFFLSRFDVVSNAFGKLAGILMPIIYGGVLAYLMLPIYNRTLSRTEEKLRRVVKTEHTRRGIGKMAATIVSLAVLLSIVAGLCWMIIPQIYDSILGLQSSIEGNVNNLTQWLTKLLEDNPSLEHTIMPLYEQMVEKFQVWLTTEAVPNASMLFNRVSTGILSVFTVVKNILIGMIVMVYFLNMKDTLCAQSKKILYGLLRVKDANRIIGEVRFAHSVFGGFITGKLLDSLIIGIMCFFAMKFLKMPYVLLVSVIIGVTNVIPFFGPFIGAIPSAFLILLVSPMKCLYFLIFILVLQQFDGNILGPKILGGSTGLPSFWVLFSILLFGGLFGFVGMVIAVPAFAVIYRSVSAYIRGALVKKNLSGRTEDYMELDYIDEEEKVYVELKKK